MSTWPRPRQARIFIVQHLNPRALAIAASVFVVLASGSARADQQRIDRVRIAGDVLEFLIPGTAFATTIGLRDYVGTTQFVTSFGTTLLTTRVIKMTVDKERPNGGDMSMPSGHTASAMGGASFLQRRYGVVPGLPAYVLGGFVAISRVVSDFHFVSDVIAGSAIAIGSTLIFVNRQPGRYWVLPGTVNGAPGLQAELEF